MLHDDGVPTDLWKRGPPETLSRDSDNDERLQFSQEAFRELQGER